jgi:hypothetical protein
MGWIDSMAMLDSQHASGQSQGGHFRQGFEQIGRTGWPLLNRIVVSADGDHMACLWRHTAQNIGIQNITGMHDDIALLHEFEDRILDGTVRIGNNPDTDRCM